MTCDQNHSYSAEQYAYNASRADRFVENTGSAKCSGPLFGGPGLVMDYYDGNTVTALWNYAQHYALNDRSFGTTYGPSSPGALNLISGQTHGITSADPASSTEHPRQTPRPDPAAVTSPDAQGLGTMTNDPDPAYDECSDHDHTGKASVAVAHGRNIGDLLSARHVSWGWFQGGFRPSTPWDGHPGHYAKCDTTHTNTGGTKVTDYSPHHSPFAYYKSTANPHHLPPAGVREIGHDGPAHHNYDLTDFHTALAHDRMPAVSLLKAPAYQDAHAAYSDPVDEQHFLVQEINAIQQSPQWKNTAIVIAYDDSDGWYDHAYTPPHNGSRDTQTGPGGRPTDSPACQNAPAPAGGYADRCGPGPRQPLLVISPYSKVNAIDHTPTEQTSITKFIEDNWHTGRLGDASLDAHAGPLTQTLDFHPPTTSGYFSTNRAPSPPSAPSPQATERSATAPTAQQAPHRPSPSASRRAWQRSARPARC
ncbi:alkaline phosphatase family protein [Streptomyces sp. ODS28]|uniref:phospholipase C n=1 Tax=Streptomyces sp. ODS28 TaxID=3136688 RepID=UPI0031EC09ED